MKKIWLTTMLMMAAIPAFAKEVVVKEITDDNGKAYFSPDKLTIQQLTKKLEDGDAAASNLPQGTGKVVSVDAEKHTMKLTHDPIKALGWPKMTMQFTVDSSMDLSGYQAGDAVSFTLKPAGKDDYTIVNLKKGS